jgi:hypothetical protein
VSWNLVIPYSRSGGSQVGGSSSKVFSFLSGSYLMQHGPSGSCFNRRHSCEFLMSNLVQLSVGRFRSTAARAAKMI